MNGKFYSTVALVIQTIVLLGGLLVFFNGIEHRLTRVETLIQYHIEQKK